MDDYEKSYLRSACLGGDKEADAFTRSLKEFAEASTTKMFAENAAAHSLALATVPLKKRSESGGIMALVWECLRRLYATDRLPSFWKFTAEKTRPDTPVPLKTWDEIFMSASFPYAAWNSVPKAERNFLRKCALPNFDKAVRFIGVREWYIKTARWALKLATEMRGDNPQQKRPAPVLEFTVDGSEEMISRFFVEVKWDARPTTLGSQFQEQVERLRRNRAPTRQNGRPKFDFNQHFRGLAALWLEDAGWTPSAIAEKLYPLPAIDHHKTGVRTDEVGIARRKACDLIETVRDSLFQAAPAMTGDASPEADEELQRAIDAFIAHSEQGGTKRIP